MAMMMPMLTPAATVMMAVVVVLVDAEER